MKKTEALYTLSIASKLSGVPIHSVKQYIDRSLILPFKKDTKRHLFSDVDVVRLKRVRKHLEEEKLNIAGIKALMAAIPCWAIRSCSPEDRKSCQGYSSTSMPCWEASEKGAMCRNTDCRECDVYCAPVEYQDLKSLIREFTN